MIPCDVYRDLTTLAGIMMLVTEDLYVGYHDGFLCVDASQQAECKFMCKVSLLLLAGDYPALAKATGFTHSGNCHCHWCKQSSPKDQAVHRHATGNFRRWLHPNSLHRAALGNFRDPEHGGPPPFRTHGEVERTGLLARHWTGPQNQHPQHATGICDWCPLAAVPGFDMVWDVAPDFMHCVLWYTRHILRALKGETKVAKPTLLKLNRKASLPAYPRAELLIRNTENERRERTNALARKVNSK